MNLINCVFFFFAELETEPAEEPAEEPKAGGKTFILLNGVNGLGHLSENTSAQLSTSQLDKY